MTIEQAIEELAGLMIKANEGPWDSVPDFVLEELVRGWQRTCKGDDEFRNLIVTLKGGHTIQSPVCPEFQYRIGGLIGRQMSLV